MVAPLRGLPVLLLVTASLVTAADKQLPFTEDSHFASGSAASQSELITKDDLLVVIPTTLSRLPLVEASRRWRRGVRTFLVADKALPFQLQEQFRVHLETWDVFHDNQDSALDVGARQGDLRATMAPFLANVTFANKYKWILYGDDDTVMFLDNVLRLLNSGTLNWQLPYLVTDCVWWPQGSQGTKLHPNREAPRCLPCDYRDPLLNGGGCPGHSGFLAPLGCPCSPQLVVQGHWAAGDPVFPDGNGIVNRTALDFVHRPGYFHSPHVGWWYMLHGGAGALISRPAMERNSLDVVQRFLATVPLQSGDAMLFRVFWHVLGLGPTDPGYGYCRKHIQVFDPGFAGYRARGKEDAGTADGGADPLGVLARLEAALVGSGCDNDCHDQLQHMVSVHVRGRHVAEEWFQDTPDALARGGRAAYQVAAHVITRLAVLGEQYALLLQDDSPQGQALPDWSASR